MLALHEACAGGDVAVTRMLLNFKYPPSCMRTYREATGSRKYRIGINVNARNGQGRTPLHVACAFDRAAIVRELLSFKTQVTSSVSTSTSGSSMRGTSHFVARSKSRAAQHRAFSQQMSQSIDSEAALRMFQSQPGPGVASPLLTDNDDTIHPVAADIDAMDLEGQTPLHVAIARAGPNSNAVLDVAQVLLDFGADANKPMISASGNELPLRHACVHNHAPLVDMLLRYGAEDPKNKILACAVQTQSDDVIGVLLRCKTRVDSSSRVNVPRLIDVYSMTHETSMTRSMSSVTFNLRRLWPSSAVAVEWSRLGLTSLAMRWMGEASKFNNSRRRSKMQPSVGIEQLSLFAVTRVDVSGNRLSQLPLQLFQLPSLRSLNAGGNVIKWLPGCSISVPRSCSCADSLASKDSANVGCAEKKCVHASGRRDTEQRLNALWDCPLLEEVDLESNKLAEIPPVLCRLPLLRKLSLARNALERLPRDLWMSESLQELDVSHNSLTQLIDVDDATSSDGSDTSGSLRLDVDSFKHVLLPAEPQDSRASVLSAQRRASLGTSNFRPADVTHASLWRERISLRDVEGGEGTSRRAKQKSRCKLLELNASHNNLQAIPDRLVCFTPSLEVLQLANNEIERLVPPAALPASLRELDLTHNCIREITSADLDSATLTTSFSSCFVTASKHHR